MSDSIDISSMADAGTGTGTGRNEEFYLYPEQFKAQADKKLNSEPGDQSGREQFTTTDRLKLGVFTFLLYVIISSSHFQSGVLSNVSGAINNAEITTTGVGIQAGTLSVLVIIFDLLIKRKVL